MTKRSPKTLPPPFKQGTRSPKDQPVPLTVLVLSKNEAPNIERAIASASWARDIVVIDSGSTDGTQELARATGAIVHETDWRGFGAQREYALRLPTIETDWVFFLDADEYVSTVLANEILDLFSGGPPEADAFWLFFTTTFLGSPIRHSGWNPGPRIVRIMRRSQSSYTDNKFSEHPSVVGKVGSLNNRIIDDDRKPFERWLHKHLEYAKLEASKRMDSRPGPKITTETRSRAFLKRHIHLVPARPIVQFLYMYFLRAGFLDGVVGLKFAFYHMWFQQTVQDLVADATQNASYARPDNPSTGPDHSTAASNENPT